MSKYQENVGPYDGLTANNALLLLIDRQVSFMHWTRHPEKKSIIRYAHISSSFILGVFSPKD